MIDVAALLTPRSDAEPSGPSVEYDPLYIELETAAKSTPQEKDAEGKEVREAKDPNWREVERLAIALCEKSKDIRVGIYLTRAELALEGLQGFLNGIDLLKGYVETFWPSVHPQLDPADDNDPRIRVSALLSLCDLDTVLRGLRAAPLTQSQQFGRVSWRDYAIADGKIPAPPNVEGVGRPDTAQVEAAFADTPAEIVSGNQKTAADSLQRVKEIDSFLQTTLGVGNGPDLEPLKNQLVEIKALMDRELAKRGGGEAVSSEPRSAAGDGAPSAPGQIRNRGDVVATLDRIIRYYRDYEPSSPIPVILERTKRLVPMGFLDILKDVAPEGMQKFGIIAGLKEEE